MNNNSKILILGGSGLVGSSLCRTFKKHGFENLFFPNRKELNLLNQSEVKNYFSENKPDVVIDAAAKVGGIHANQTFRADFIIDNLTIQNNLFGASLENKVSKFLFLGSSCIYPKNCPQPMSEEHLLTGPLEETNEPYAIAKIAGLKTAESIKAQYGLDYFSVMPTNLYGVNDNFHPKNSHVIPGLIVRMEQAIKNNDPVFKAWGTGRPKREFLYVDDLSDACIYLLSLKEDIPNWINVGTGEDISIKELVKEISMAMGYDGLIEFDSSFPDGTPRKLLNVGKIHQLGWQHKIDFKRGLKKTIEHFRSSSNVRSY